MIQKEVQKGDIHGVTIARGAPMVTHLFFANDSFLFCRDNSLESNVLNEVLVDYASVSR